MVKFVKLENLLAKNYVVNYRANPGCTTEDIARYIKSIIRRNSDVILVHTVTNDLNNSVSTMNKVKKMNS